MTTTFMDDAFIMTTAFFDFLTPPFLANGHGEGFKPNLASPPANCKLCGQPLIEQDFPKYTALTCDNWRCHIYRQPQAYREKEPRSEPNRLHASATLRPGYAYYLEQKKENYHLLRNLGISSVEASRMTSNKQTREIEERARSGTQLNLLDEDKHE